MIPKSLPFDLIRGWTVLFGEDHQNWSAMTIQTEVLAFEEFQVPLLPKAKAPESDAHEAGVMHSRSCNTFPNATTRAVQSINQGL
jgi:hypothetical protein